VGRERERERERERTKMSRETGEAKAEYSAGVSALGEPHPFSSKECGQQLRKSK
jgi:hypothetical protein